MARKKSIVAIEEEIKKTQNSMEKVKEKYDKLADKLTELFDMKKQCEAEAIMEAYINSGKSYNELMTFLGA